MEDTKAERLAAALNGFIRSSPDVEATAVISYDGLAMASALPETMDEDRLGAMSAALLSLGEQAARGLGRGDMHQLFVEGEYGFVFLMSARDQAVLAAVTDRTAKIGFMLFEMRRAAEVIGDILSEPSVGDAAEAGFADAHAGAPQFHDGPPVPVAPGFAATPDGFAATPDGFAAAADGFSPADGFAPGTGEAGPEPLADLGGLLPPWN